MTETPKRWCFRCGMMVEIDRSQKVGVQLVAHQCDHGKPCQPGGCRECERIRQEARQLAVRGR